MQASNWFRWVRAGEAVEKACDAVDLVAGPLDCCFQLGGLCGECTGACESCEPPELPELSELPKDELKKLKRSTARPRHEPKISGGRFESRSIPAPPVYLARRG